MPCKALRGQCSYIIDSKIREICVICGKRRLFGLCLYSLNLNSGIMLSEVMSSYHLSRLSGKDFRNGFMSSP